MNDKITRSMKTSYFYESIILISVCFLIIYSIYRKIKGYRGTWSPRYTSELLLTSSFNRKSSDRFQRNTGDRSSDGADSKGETECRRVLRHLFNKPFNKVRPSFLRNHITDGENNLELDCYDDDLKIAVEYNGVQHYKYVPFFHKTKDAFYNQKYRDDMKRRLCKENGITLIEVPYNIKLENIRHFIVSELRQKMII